MLKTSWRQANVCWDCYPTMRNFIGEKKALKTSQKSFFVLKAFWRSISIKLERTLHKNWSFSLRIYSVNMTKYLMHFMCREVFDTINHETLWIHDITLVSLWKTLSVPSCIYQITHLKLQYNFFSLIYQLKFVIYFELSSFLLYINDMSLWIWSLLLKKTLTLI